MPERFVFRGTDENGDTIEVELTPEQALDFGSGKAVGYVVRDQELLANEDGTFTQRESAVPDERRDDTPDKS
jgi:hypothetical protein